MPETDERHLPKWNKLDGVDDARRRQMRAVKTAERLMYNAYERGDEKAARKAVTTLTQAVRCYLQAVEVHEMEERLQRLEDFVERQYEHTNGQRPDR